MYVIITLNQYNSFLATLLRILATPKCVATPSLRNTDIVAKLVPLVLSIQHSLYFIDFFFSYLVDLLKIGNCSNNSYKFRFLSIDTVDIEIKIDS